MKPVKIKYNVNIIYYCIFASSIIIDERSTISKKCRKSLTRILVLATLSNFTHLPIPIDFNVLYHLTKLSLSLRFIDCSVNRPMIIKSFRIYLLIFRLLSFIFLFFSIVILVSLWLFHITNDRILTGFLIYSIRLATLSISRTFARLHTRHTNSYTIFTSFCQYTFLHDGLLTKIEGGLLFGEPTTLPLIPETYIILKS